MPAERLFNRKARLKIFSTTVPIFDDAYNVEQADGDVGLIIEDHRIEFDIEHNLTKHPNRCTVKVTNLSESSRAALKKEPLRMVLEAGYESDQGMSVVFTGDVTYVLSSLNGSDWVTTIEGGDGDRVLANARVNKTYAAGTTVDTILADVFKSVGQELPASIRDSDIFKKAKEHVGKAINGKFKDTVSNLLKPYGYQWSIQDGQPVVLREHEVTGETCMISEATGMIGSPEFGKPDRKGKAPDVTIRTFLYPEIRPGRPVIVESRDLKGTFKVKKVQHRGDTHGGDWATEVEINPTPIQTTPGSVRDKIPFGSAIIEIGKAGVRTTFKS